MPRSEPREAALQCNAIRDFRRHFWRDSFALAKRLSESLGLVYMHDLWQDSLRDSFFYADGSKYNCPMLDQLLRHLKCAFLYTYDGAIFDGSNWRRLNEIGQ